MQTYKIAVYPGDGIGTEVTREVLRVLAACEEQAQGFHLEFTEFPWGVDYYFKEGRVVPDDYLEILAGFDAIYLGALGDPRRLPDHITLSPLIRARQTFDQYACVRPAKLFPGVRSPLSLKPMAKIDMVVVRENSEGEYVDNGGRFRKGAADEFAVQVALHTRKGIERILRFGFDLAQKRRQRLSMITKSNALKYGFVLWDEILEEMTPAYPSIEVDKFHIDAAVMNFVRMPEHFDVVVGSNLFGDILTDLSAILVGGMGLAPSANINPDRKFPSMFEPVHGSAPDIAGKGIANPVAAILSAAMMLEWLNEDASAQSIHQAVEKTLADGHGTPDLGGSLNTSTLTDKIIANLEGIEPC